MNTLRITATVLLVGATAFAMATPFEIVVTETKTGSNPNPSDWGGIQRFSFTGTGSAATQLSTIPAGLLSDPAGLCFNGNELFVGNRHGNSSASSISRFLYDWNTDTFTANGTITGNGLFGVHGLELRPGTNDLWASNVNNGLSGFTVTGGGATANGTLMSGAKREVMFSHDGRYLYATEGVSGNLVRYDFNTSTTTSYAISGASGLHNAAWRGDHLFISDFGSSQVFDVAFDANGAVASSSVAASVSGAISLAFSPDSNEMFVASHTGNKIDRFLYNSGTSSWDFESSIATSSNMGDIQILVPEPASFAVLGLGALALLRRRKKA